MNCRTLSLAALLPLSLLIAGCDEDNGTDMTQPDFVTQVELADGEGNSTASLTAGADASVILRVRNRSGSAQTLEFPDERTSDFLIKNESGEIVKLWSAGRGFAEVITDVDFEAGETREFEMEWSATAHDDGQTLSPGSYEVQGWMPQDDTDGTDDLRPSEFRSTLKPFEIVEAGDF